MFVKFGVKVYRVNCLLGIAVDSSSFNLLSNSYIAKNINPARNIDLINWSSLTDSVKKPSLIWAQCYGTILIIP